MTGGTAGYAVQVAYKGTDAGMQVRVLPRLVLKWLQSLKLSAPVGKAPRREIANGYAVVEILARYGYHEKDQELRVNSFENEMSLDRRVENWKRITTMLLSKKHKLPKKLVDATIHSKNGAAEYMLELLHSILTNTPMKEKLPDNYIFDDTDYQATLRPHARSTAAKKLHANIRSGEFVTEPNKLKQTQNVQKLIANHRDQTSLDRETNPSRYDRVTLDATGHQQLPTPPGATAASSRRNSGSRRLSGQVVTQRMSTPPSRLSTAASLSPIKVASNTSGTLTPLKVTKRLEDSLN